MVELVPLQPDARLDLAASPLLVLPYRTPLRLTRHAASTKLAAQTPSARWGMQMDPQLTLAVHSDGHGEILRVGGEVDLATAPQLRAKLMDLVSSGTGSVVVDLTPVAFADSSGLAALLAGHWCAAARGRSLRLVCHEGPVLRVLRLTGIAMVIPVYRSLDEAMGTQPASAHTD